MKHVAIVVLVAFTMSMAVERTAAASESLQPVVDYLTSIGVKKSSKEAYTPETLAKVYRLRLAMKKDVNDDVLAKHISKLTNLVGISLDGTSVTNAGLAHLAVLPKLQELDLGSLKGVTGEAFPHLAKYPALKSLVLQGTGVSVDDLKTLPDYLPNLTKLRLDWLKVDGAMTEIGKLKNLKELGLFKTDLTDAGAAGLAGLTNLERLFVWKTFITDEGLKNVSGLVNIRTLYIEGTQVTDAGMVYLSGLEKLDYLWMNDLPITDKGLSQLKSCTSLRNVQAKKTQITDAGVADLTAALPKVRVSK